MLDGFEILTTSGVVLWSRSYVPVNTSLVNGFIKDVFIEEKVLPGGAAAVVENDSAAKNLPYKKDQYTLKWASVKDLGLIFVVRICVFVQDVQNMPWLTGPFCRPSTNLYFIYPGSTSC